MVVRRWLRMVVVALAVAAVACSLEEASPVEPADDTPAAASSTDPSLVLGAPAASPTPLASPGPTPEPEPAAPPPSSTGPCFLPASNPANPTCTSDPGHLLGSVEAAIKAVTQKRLALFDFNDKACGDCYKVRDAKGYYAAVRAELASRGICTYTDMEEISAKDSNESSEQFDILLASGHIRRGPGVYRGICSPAIF